MISIGRLKNIVAERAWLFRKIICMLALDFDGFLSWHESTASNVLSFSQNDSLARKNTTS